jgi:signal transduction histidine kinase
VAKRTPAGLPVRLIFAFSLVGLAYAFSYFIEPISQGHSLFLFISAVILASLYGGLVTGILSSLFAAFLHSYAFQEPRNLVGIHSVGDVIQIVAFLVVAIFLSFIGAAMRDARRKAEQASEAREDVLAVVSHDLRNPLAAIKISVELALRKSDNKRAIESIGRAADRMESLIADILDHERIRGGRLHVSPTKQDLHALMSEVTEIGAPLAAQTSIEFQISSASVHDASFVSGERIRLLQVFSNLIGNAVKFTPEKGRVTVKVLPLTEKTEFVIEDTGPGIKSEDLPKVFDRYWQAKQTAKLGTGLGLSIAKGIVDAHGGEIWVECESGKGCAFHFTIPNGN